MFGSYEGPSAKKKEKKNRPPKGFAQLPEWWMDITPHNTLDIEGDAAKRFSERQQAMIYKDLAEKADLEEKNGLSNKYRKGENGELIDNATGKTIDPKFDSRFSQDKKGDWFLDGKPIFGAQYVSIAAGNSYGHKDVSWKKPDWMKVKLNATKKGAAMKRGSYLEKKSFVPSA